MVGAGEKPSAAANALPRLALRQGGGGTAAILQKLVAARSQDLRQAVIGKSADTRILSWSRGAEQLYGYSAREMVGQPMARLLPPERAGEIEVLMERLRRGESILEQETQRMRKDGRRVDISLTITAIRDGDGKLLSYAAIAHDISERKRAEAKLQAAERQYRLLFEKNPQPMWVVDPESRAFLDVNEAAMALYGYTREEFLAMKLDAIRSADEGQRLRDYFARLESGYSRAGIWRHQTKAGQPLVMEITRDIVPYHGREAMLVVAQDITERRRLETQLQHAQKLEAIGQLAGGVAHDFNNLLTVITGYGQMIFDRLGENDPARPQMAAVLTAAERATAMTRQLLTFSRRQEAEPRAVNLNQVIEANQAILGRLIGDHVQVVLRPALELAAIRADPGQIEQILFNLAINARDAMPQGGRLTIETGNVEFDAGSARAHLPLQPGRYAMLAVSDTGVGMDAATQKRIFEPYFTTKPQGRGTGLGLATVYGIVRKHEGHICVFSEPGRGATFKLYFPCQADGAGSREERKELLRGRETIFFVEDDAVLRQLCDATLRALGYRVFCAATGEEALELARAAGPIELLAADLILPGIPGSELAQKLRAQWPGMVVLFFSGFTETMAERNGGRLPESHFLQKPFTAQALARQIQRLLQSRRKPAPGLTD